MKGNVLYENEKWLKFRNDVLKFYGVYCGICGRGKDRVVLNVHHSDGIYVIGRKPWEYEICDCEVLCFGCHSREHGLLEPDSGWFLFKILDLEDLTGECQRESSPQKLCNQKIRYEQHIIHPFSGENIVGSTCVDHLTAPDRIIVKDIKEAFNKLENHMKSFYNKKSRYWDKYDNTKFKKSYSYIKNTNKGNVSCYIYKSKFNGDRYNMTFSFNKKIMDYGEYHSRFHGIYLRNVTEYEFIFLASCFSYIKLNSQSKPHLKNLYKKLFLEKLKNLKYNKR